MITAIALVYALWVFYLAVMALWRAQREGLIGPVAKVPGYLTLALGGVLDIAVNITLGSLVFLELPPMPSWRLLRLSGVRHGVGRVLHALLLTTRLQRHIAARNGGWRARLASWLCRHLLNPFDPTGNHCD